LPDIRWLLYAIAAVISIGVIVRYLNLSPVHLAIRALTEIRDVITNPNVTRTSIDGGLTILMSLVTVACVFFLLIEKLSSVVLLLVSGIEKENQSLLFIVFLMFFDALVVILSLLITRRSP
jgi:hypothetical protein